MTYLRRQLRALRDRPLTTALPWLCLATAGGIAYVAYPLWLEVLR